MQLEKSYLAEIKKLSKGSIQYKKIRGHSYPYLAFRNGPHVVYEYLGGLSESKRKEIESEVSQRRKFENLLKEVRKNIARLERILYGRRRAA